MLFRNFLQFRSVILCDLALIWFVSYSQTANCIFFVRLIAWNLQLGVRLDSCFWKTFHLLYLLCKHRALSLHVQVVTMLKSLTMSRTAKITQTLNTRDLTSQLESCKNSDSFSLGVFLKFSRDFVFCSHKALVYLLVLSPCVHVVCFPMQKLKFFDFFLVWFLQMTSEMEPIFLEDPSCS